jgi:tRNA modification GTPase
MAMFVPNDTIVGIATPPGRGGIGVVRLSGPSAQEIARQLLRRSSPLQPRRATFSRLFVHAATGDVPLDTVVVTLFQGPRSYTGEDVVEISAHGSPVILDAAVNSAVERGARLARSGEFTFRAFINGRIDLTQAEAVADLVDAVTPRQAAAACEQLGGSLAGAIGPISERLFSLVTRLEASLDFPDEGYHFITPGEMADTVAALGKDLDTLLDTAHRGALLRQGAQAVILGLPNTGKSTLFNALVGSNRAIVSPTPGTTRDLITETIDVGGVPVTLVDSAGVRSAGDAVEDEAIGRALAAAKAAAVVIVVLDGSREIRSDDRELVGACAGFSGVRLLVRSKCDLPAAWSQSCFGQTIDVSSEQGFGVSLLTNALQGAVSADRLAELPTLTNTRHRDLVRRASMALARVADVHALYGGHMPEEILLVELNDARSALEEVTGARTSEDILATIFERFCIGK